MKPMDSLSEKRLYRETLSAIEKARPVRGNICKGIFFDDKSLLPTISYPDIVNYLIFTPSPYSKDDLKAYKGLNCYVQAYCGWVSEVKAAVVGDRHVVIGKVLHSMRLKENPLNPWLISEKNGSILASHCD
ncbi:hypothetical protein MAR_018940 [Mya arenaria]|uniref:Uncharacterized protein n=1 Tax=Mya arenaria TaxID=6604 RepID=A0ABY7EJ71_MYAAR|nr:hypothetical protein MAR_018940 [Mya arenaria]